MNLDPIEFRPVILKPKLTTLTLRVILLHHKHPLNLSGTCRIQCLIGEAQILGATLSGCDYKDGANFNTFCAPLPLPPIKVSAKKTESNPLLGQEKLCKTRLEPLSIDYDEVKKEAKRGFSAAILVDESLANIKRLEKIMKIELFKPLEVFHPTPIFECCYMTEVGKALLEGDNFETFKRMRQVVGVSWLNAKRTVIMFVGPKDSGKSTVAKLLTNTMFTKRPTDMHSLFFLDCDVGQSEFTPPGLLSLHKISNFILSVPFGSQLKTFPRSYYYGSISPESNSELYTSIIAKLYDDFIKLSEADEHSLLVINTLGWVQDLGFEILQYMVSLFKPNEILATDQEIGRKLSAKLVMTPYSSEQQHGKVTAATHRSRNITGYLAHCLVRSYSTQVSSFSEVSVRMVSFDYISIFIHPSNLVDDSCYLAALNMSTVALCSIPEEFEDSYESSRLMNNDNLPKKILKKLDSKVEPFLRCYGYGLIRAISMEKKKIYLITPTSQNELKNVTVLSLGEEICTPRWIFEAQATVNAPYLMQTTSGRSEAFNKLSMPLKIVSGHKRNHLRQIKR